MIDWKQEAHRWRRAYWAEVKNQNFKPRKKKAKKKHKKQHTRPTPEQNLLLF